MSTIIECFFFFCKLTGGPVWHTESRGGWASFQPRISWLAHQDFSHPRFVISAIPHSCTYLGNMLNNNKKITDCVPFFYRRCHFFFSCVCVRMPTPKRCRTCFTLASLVHFKCGTQQKLTFSLLYLSLRARRLSPLVPDAERRSPIHFCRSLSLPAARLLCFRGNAKRRRRRRCRYIRPFVLITHLSDRNWDETLRQPSGFQLAFAEMDRKTCSLLTWLCHKLPQLMLTDVAFFKWLTPIFSEQAGQRPLSSANIGHFLIW